MSDDTVRTGGCQCGAVRFRIRGPLGRSILCHCRMCQKHFGSLFSVLVAAKGEVEWSRQPNYFRSSANIERGFCGSCGTPITFRSPDGWEIAVGTFDDRSDLAPQIQVNHGARLPWIEQIFDAPIRDSSKDAVAQEGIVSFQHPDHETETWPLPAPKS